MLSPVKIGVKPGFRQTVGLIYFRCHARFLSFLAIDKGIAFPFFPESIEFLVNLVRRFPGFQTSVIPGEERPIGLGLDCYYGGVGHANTFHKLQRVEQLYQQV